MPEIEKTVAQVLLFLTVALRLSLQLQQAGEAGTPWQRGGWAGWCTESKGKDKENPPRELSGSSEGKACFSSAEQVVGVSLVHGAVRQGTSPAQHNTLVNPPQTAAWAQPAGPCTFACPRSPCTTWDPLPCTSPSCPHRLYADCVPVCPASPWSQAVASPSPAPGQTIQTGCRAKTLVRACLWRLFVPTTALPEDMSLEECLHQAEGATAFTCCCPQPGNEGGWWPQALTAHPQLLAPLFPGCSAQLKHFLSTSSGF